MPISGFIACKNGALNRRTGISMSWKRRWHSSRRIQSSASPGMTCAPAASPCESISTSRTTLSPRPLSGSCACFTRGWTQTGTCRGSLPNKSSFGVPGGFDPSLAPLTAPAGIHTGLQTGVFGLVGRRSAPAWPFSPALSLGGLVAGLSKSFPGAFKGSALAHGLGGRFLNSLRPVRRNRDRPQLRRDRPLRVGISR